MPPVDTDGAVLLGKESVGEQLQKVLPEGYLLIQPDGQVAMKASDLTTDILLGIAAKLISDRFEHYAKLREVMIDQQLAAAAKAAAKEGFKA